MEADQAVAIIVGIMGILSYLSKLPSFGETTRVLEGETECFSARVQDFKREVEISSSRTIGLGKKRKRDKCERLVEGEMLVEEAQRVLARVANVRRGWRSLFMGLSMRCSVYKLSSALKYHDGILSQKQAMPGAPSPCHGYHIPVNRVVGQLASKTLAHLKHLFDSDKIARIAIYGIQGIGKTFLMKHLHNYAYSLDCFNYVFWVSCPLNFTIKCVQDALAALVKCDIAADDDLFVRAAKLSAAFAKLGSFALFLDGVSKDDFLLEHVGIPVPGQGSKRMLVLTTTSVLEPRLLNCFETVEIQCLPKEDAYELFMHKANIGKESVSSLDGIPLTLADKCYGVPRVIENKATHLCGIDDPREWRYALHELYIKPWDLMKKKKPPFYTLGDLSTVRIP